MADTDTAIRIRCIIGVWDGIILLGDSGGRTDGW